MGKYQFQFANVCETEEECFIDDVILSETLKLSQSGKVVYLVKEFSLLLHPRIYRGGEEPPEEEEEKGPQVVKVINRSKIKNEIFENEGIELFTEEYIEEKPKGEEQK